ncbi:hypothetical protein ACHAXR_007476 [Thalassiosira sp. AJA248-18]
MAKKRSRRPQPLAPPPQSSTLRSRKRARQVTTLFHKYTRERDAALARARAGGCRHIKDEGPDHDDGGVVDVNDNLSSRQIALMDEVKKWNDKISSIGGREEYQRASQMNTSLFSTSKWVLGILGKWGWLDGLPILYDDDSGSLCNTLDKDTDADTTDNYRKIKSKKEKRDVKLLEVGAINTQLIDAAARTRTGKNNASNNNEQRQTDNHVSADGISLPTNQTGSGVRVYHLDVTAIDIRSTDARIQQMDFFDLPLPACQNQQRNSEHTSETSFLSTIQPYDAIVNSMVINCVTTPAQRGEMLSLCYRHLRPGGILFLTLPKLCLIQSKFMSRSYFEEILTIGVGFEILQEVGRDSPKVAFFVLRRPKEEGGNNTDEIRNLDDKFKRMPMLHRGKKFRNTFAVTLG